MRTTVGIAVLALAAAAGCERGNDSGSSAREAADRGTPEGEPAAGEAPAIGSFRAVELRLGAQTTIRRGDEPDVRIHAEPEVRERVVAEVARGTLTLSCARAGAGDDGEKVVIRGGGGQMTVHRDAVCPDVDLEITLPVLDRLAIIGSGNVAGASTFAGDAVEIAVAGSGRVRMAVRAARVTVDVSGSGNVQLEGEADEVGVTIDGSGVARLFDLGAARAKVAMSGSGTAEVHATERLDVSVSGSGTVDYRGDPEVSRSVTGSGSVSPE